MGETEQDAQQRPERPGLGFASSLCVLVAVFYFINAACFDTGSCSSSGDAGTPPETAPDGGPVCVTPAPTGASIRFDAPLPGAVIIGPVVDGGVAVPVALSATGLTVVPSDGRCTVGEGHFNVFSTALTNRMGVVQLLGGESSTTVQLPPGMHKLTATFNSGSGRQYTPFIQATVSITVQRQAP